MKAVSQRAQKVLNALIENLNSIGDNNKIDNNAFMAVHVEFINSCKLGAIYSVAHYYEQNGDLMRDPDMEFLRGVDGKYYPLSFWQDGVPTIRDEPVEWEDGEIVTYQEKEQSALVSFANEWMKNIKEQQRL